MPDSDTPALSDRPRPIIQMRRGASLIGAVVDEEGRPVVSVCCDCATTTDVVLADAVTAPNGTYEVAIDRGAE
jgi:hypothetical protein